MTILLTAAAGLTGVQSAAADPASGTVYTLESATAGRVLEVPSGQTANGTTVQIWDASAGTNQQWRFDRNGDGTYTLTNVATGRVLDEPGGQTANGTRLIIWDSNGGANQHWRVGQNADGSVTLANVASGRVLDVPGGQTANGTFVQVWDSNGGANQHWNLTPAGSSGGTGSLPTSFRWSSSGPLIAPKPDATHNIAGIKDPSVVYYNGKWHVFASVANSAGYSMVYLSFTDWSQAGSATHYYLDRSGIGTGYRAAPQVFYFAPQKLWYLVYQTGNASYSTNPDISNPNGWSAPHNFYSSMPPIIAQNIGNGYWVDMWVICDTANCYLFSSDDNGHLYRSQTSVSQFPNGFTNTVIAAQDSNKYALFEASNVYKVAGTDRYLLIVEAIGGDGRRYFRSWTSGGIAGSWTPLAATESNPFARASNTTFPSGTWTQDISHGEMVRAGYDQTLTVDPCKIQYLYQGKDPNAGGDYNNLPWRLALLTQTNSTC